MKFILSILLLVITTSSFSQIFIKGARDTKVIESNENKNEAKEINESNYTESKQDGVIREHEYKNDYEDHTFNSDSDVIRVNISNLDPVKQLEKDNVKSEKEPVVTKKVFEEVLENITETETIETEKVQPISSTITEPKVSISQVSETDNTVQEEIKTTPKPIIVEEKILEKEVVEIQNEKIAKEKVIAKEEISEPVYKADIKKDAKEEDYEEIAPATLNSENPSKKNTWSVGLQFGIPAIIGDVNSKAGYGAALKIQKSFSHLFSLRLQALALETYGLNTKNGFANYKTRFSDYTLQGVFTLNNISYYTENPKVLINVMLGGGLATRYTWTDLYDEDGNLHDYSGVSMTSKKETRADLKTILDKNHETSIALDEDKMSIKNTNILPSIVLGLGLDFKLSQRIDLNLESRLSYHFDDNLDGLKSVNANDWMTFTSLGITYKFGPNPESMQWSNPLYENTKMVKELDEKINKGGLFNDADQDGIADALDQEPNTPPNVNVNSKGIASDLDNDGIPDYQDEEPFSPLGVPVDADGKTIDSDQDGIADIFDKEPNSASGSYVDKDGVTIKNPNRLSHSDAQSESDFDLVFFKENSAKVNKEFYSSLYKIFRHIQSNPKAIIRIIGHTDVLASEQSNMDLSEKRALSVYKMLVELFKVPAKNLEIGYHGESKPIIEGLPEQKDYKLEPAYYINRRVEFKIIE